MIALFARGFAIVILTATNVYQIAHAHYPGAFLCGMAISIVWWGNAKSSGKSDVPHAGWWYGLGAGFGTIAGMWLMHLVYG